MQKGFLTESDGTPSSSRVIMCVIILFNLAWVSVGIYNHPEMGIVDIPTSWMTLIGILYGVNKIAPQINLGGK